MSVVETKRGADLQLDRPRRKIPQSRASSWRTFFRLSLLVALVTCIAQTSIPRPDISQWLGITSPDVLILTAHPDDECMFFAPVILALVERGIPVRALSLSTGEFGPRLFFFHGSCKSDLDLMHV